MTTTAVRTSPDRPPLAAPAKKSFFRRRHPVVCGFLAGSALVVGLAGCRSGGTASADGHGGDTSTTVLANRGGQSQRQANLYLVWLGNSASDAGVVHAVNGGIASLDHSQYLNRLHQYGVDNITLVDVGYDAMVPGGYPQVMSDVLAHHPSWIGDPNAQVILVLPQGVANGLQEAAGFHSSMNVLGQHLRWSVIDYPDNKIWSDGTRDIAAALQSMITHEVVETATDDFRHGWGVKDGSKEAADICDWKITPTDAGAVQQYWSNSDMGCWPKVPGGTVLVMHPSGQQAAGLG